MRSLKARRYKVFVKPYLQTSVGLCKPDVLAVSEEQKAYLIDHTVVWERGDLSRHFDDKENYYTNSDIFDRVSQLHPSVKEVVVCGLVVTAHGVWGDEMKCYGRN